MHLQQHWVLMGTWTKPSQLWPCRFTHSSNPRPNTFVPREAPGLFPELFPALRVHRALPGSAPCTAVVQTLPMLSMHGAHGDNPAHGPQPHALSSCPASPTAAAVAEHCRPAAPWGQSPAPAVLSPLRGTRPGANICICSHLPVSRPCCSSRRVRQLPAPCSGCSHTSHAFTRPRKAKTARSSEAKGRLTPKEQSGAEPELGVAKHSRHGDLSHSPAAPPAPQQPFHSSSAGSGGLREHWDTPRLRPPPLPPRGLPFLDRVFGSASSQKLPDSPRGTQDGANEAASLPGYGSVLRLAPSPAPSSQEHADRLEESGSKSVSPLQGPGGNALQPPPPASGSSPAAPSPALPALSIASDCFANN